MTLALTSFAFGVAVGAAGLFLAAIFALLRAAGLR